MLHTHWHSQYVWVRQITLARWVLNVWSPSPFLLIKDLLFKMTTKSHTALFFEREQSLEVQIAFFFFYFYQTQTGRFFVFFQPRLGLGYWCVIEMTSKIIYDHTQTVKLQREKEERKISKILSLCHTVMYHEL